MDTGSGYALIRKSNLPSDWERYVIEGAATPKIRNANGHALKIEAMVHLTTRLGNSIYQVPFLVVESLAVDVILGTAFMKEHEDHICCREQLIDIHKGSTILLLTASEVFPQRREDPCGDDGAPSSAEPDPEKHVYEDTSGKRARSLQNTHSLRLASHIRLPPMSQTAVEVTTGARGLCFLEPKLTLQARNNVRLANGVVDIEDGSRFQVLLSDFSKVPRRLPKGAVLGCAVRDPVAIITPERKLAEKCGEVLDITTLSARGQGRSELCEPSWEEPTLDPPAAIPLREPVNVAKTQELRDEHAGDSEEAPTPAGDKPRNWKDELDLSHIDDEELRSRVIAILEKHSGMWDGSLGEINATCHRLPLVDGARPHREMPRRTGPETRRKIAEEVRKMLHAGVIEPAASEWASPVVLVGKNGGGLRFCVDYRRLNMKTMTDSYPLQRMDDCIDSLGTLPSSVRWTATAGTGRSL